MSRRCRSHTGIVRNVQDEMDGKLELRVMDDELVSTPDFLGYAQLEHKVLLYKMPGQGWRNLDLVDDPAGISLWSAGIVHGSRRLAMGVLYVWTAWPSHT